MSIGSWMTDVAEKQKQVSDGAFKLFNFLCLVM